MEWGENKACLAEQSDGAVEVEVEVRVGKAKAAEEDMASALQQIRLPKKKEQEA